jgi:geranylgeranyl pyrophosphate synthase
MRERTDVRRALVLAASAIELIHTASLVHDDLLDGAKLRRGRPTIASTGGEALAIPTGDLLFSRAFAALTECEPLVGADITRVCVSWLAETARELAEGEALQARQTGDYGLGVDEYLHRCRLKTGTLFGTAMRIGALIGGATHAEAELLRIFGTDVGVAFQIVDDTLDVTGTAPKLGKEPGADLRDGTVTLPTLLAIHERPDIAASIRALESGGQVDETLALIRSTSGPATAGQRAQSLALAAWQRVSTLSTDRWNMQELQRVHDAAVQRLN